MASKTIASNFFNHPASSASFFLKNENSLTPSSFEFQGDFGNLPSDSSTSIALSKYLPLEVNFDSFYQDFLQAASHIEKLNSDVVLIPSVDKSLRYMLYANVVTCLETYLRDALVSVVSSHKKFLRKFVETFHSFSDTKVSLNSLFSRYESIKEDAVKEMNKVSYHNLAKVTGIYYDTLEIAFPKNMDLLYKAVSIRHDIVHRNGKDINGKFQNISKDDVEELVTQVKEFVAYIHRNLLTVTTELE